MNRLLSSRVRILGVAFDDLDPHEVVRAVITESLDGRGGWIVTPNVDIMRQIAGDAELAGLVGRATLVIVDGAPVQWAGRIAGHKHIQRVPGASLALPLAVAARDAGVPLLLLGGRPGAAEQAAAQLKAALPGLRVDDHCPDFGFEDDPQRWDDVRAAVRASSGGIVLCGFGCPKQERVMDRLFEEFPDTWFLGVGGTLDFLAGYVPRAPEWMQRAGFEWVYRLAVEPKRLARRYLVDGLPFAMHLMVWAAKERQGAPARRNRRALPAARPAVPVPAARAGVAPVATQAPAVPAPRIQSIDLDRRTVSLLPTGPGQPVVEVGFTEYLAARNDPSHDGTGPDLVLDLRDGVREANASAMRDIERAGARALPDTTAASPPAPAQDDVAALPVDRHS